jgi:hypothetical protein
MTIHIVALLNDAADTTHKQTLLHNGRFYAIIWGVASFDLERLS